MRNFIRYVRAFLFFMRNFPYTPLPNGYWTMDDARNWSAFATGETGTKIRLILRNKVEQSASRAVMESGEQGRYLCGLAFGIRSTVAELDSFLDPMGTKEALSMSDDELAEILTNRNT